MREHIITAVAALLLANSAVAGDVSIQVCLELDREKYCSGGSRQFEPGTVHVLFESSQPFKTKRAVGKLYALESGQRIFLGETAFEFTAFRAAPERKRSVCIGRATFPFSTALRRA